MKKSLAKRCARAGVIAGLYAVTALITMPVASGAVQIRISEGLTLLPLFFFEAVPALSIGCLIANFLTGCALPDVLLGSLVTLVSAMLTYIVGKFAKSTLVKIILGGIFPVLLNAFILPLIWIYCYGALEYVYTLQVALLLLGQSVSVYAVGAPLFTVLKKYKDKGVSFLEE